MASPKRTSVGTGYPAWAGIDRGLDARPYGVYRLPRVGGDRPESLDAEVQRYKVTPRGRG